MSGHGDRAPLVGALALALGGVLLLAVSRDAGEPTTNAGTATSDRTTRPPSAAALRLRSSAPQPAPTGLPVAAPPTGPDAIPDPAGSATLADPLAGPVPDSYLQDLLNAASAVVPTVMPAATRNAAVQAAGRLLVADLTGTGRDEFPGFWAEPAHSVWSRIRIQASTVQTAGLDPLRVTATLIWAGTSPTGQRVERRRTVVTMELTDDRWWPVSVG